MKFTALLFVGLAAVAQAADLKPGRASGTYTYDGRTVAIEHATTFIDQADEPHALVLILSNEAVATEGWKDGSDFMKYRMRRPFLGVAFWLDADRKVLRAAFFDADGLPQGEDNGLFELKLQDGQKSLAGIAVSTEKASKLKKPVVLDVEFNAAPLTATVVSRIP